MAKAHLGCGTPAWPLWAVGPIVFSKPAFSGVSSPSRSCVRWTRHRATSPSLAGTLSEC